MKTDEEITSEKEENIPQKTDLGRLMAGG